MDENSDAAATRESGPARRSPITLQPLWPDANVSSGTRGQGIAYLLCSTPLSQSAEARQASGSGKNDLLLIILPGLHSSSYH